MRSRVPALRPGLPNCGNSAKCSMLIARCVATCAAAFGLSCSMYFSISAKSESAWRVQTICMRAAAACACGPKTGGSA